jgi:adenine-specific DNA-methyltransferase
MNVPSLRSSDTGALALASRTTRTRAIAPPTVTRSLPPQECKVYTPQLLAEAMVRAINPQPDDLWLDPCMGPGAFISALRNNGLTKKRIVGVDIDACPSAEDEAATTVRGVDFFDWCASTKRRFTKVVANPPYVALCKLGADLQQSVQQFHDSEDPTFALRSNYWCAFLSACVGLLKPHGSLAFVLPAAWDYAIYARELRERVLSSFKSVEVHRSLQPLFPEVREGRVVLVAKGYLQTPEHAGRIDHSTATSLIAALTRPIPQTGRAESYAPTVCEVSGTRFGDLFSVGIGCVTGDVNYFLLTESQRLEHDLPTSALRPVVSKARHLVASQIAKVIWDRLRRADERVWLFSPDVHAQRNRAVRAYLSHGEKVCNLDGYKLRNRDHWYEVPGIRFGVGFMSGMTSAGPWLSLRSMRGLAATNTLYVITANEMMTIDEQAAWALSLLSSETRRQVRATLRCYPDGLTKLEPHDTSELQLLPPKRIAGSREAYHHAITLLLSGDIAAATAIADASVVRRPKETLKVRDGAT